MLGMLKTANSVFYIFATRQKIIEEKKKHTEKRPFPKKQHRHSQVLEVSSSRCVDVWDRDRKTEARGRGGGTGEEGMGDAGRPRSQRWGS